MPKKSTVRPKTPRKAPGASTVETETLRRSIGFSLRRAQLSTYKEFGRFMDPLDVRPSQFAVLVLIRDNPGFSQSAISQTLGIQRANFVSLLDELQHRGWVERRKAENDRRSFALHLTREGEAIMKQVQAAHANFERGLLQRLDERSGKALLRLLNQFADAAGS
jgi:DNA-binding MarR family transcriptional regulator